MSDSREGPLMNSVLHLLHRAGQAADELFAKEMEGSDLTPRQFAVLVVLAKHENASQTDIVNATGIDRSTLADIVKRLVDRGLLNRKRSKLDARAYSVRLTAAGNSTLKSTTPVAHRVEDAILKSLPTSQRSGIVDALAAIVRGSNPAERPAPVILRARR